MNRALKATQDKNINPKKLSESPVAKENSTNKREIQCNEYSPERVHTDSCMKENINPSCIACDPSQCYKEMKVGRWNQCTASKRLEVKTIDLQAEPQGGTNQTNITPRVALLEEETTTLIAKLQSSYKLSCDVLKEIQKEKAELFDLSPLRTVSNQSEESHQYVEVSAYCQERQCMSKSYHGVELDVYEEISSYCAEKMVLLASMTELDTIKKEKDDLFIENNELRNKIEFQSSCFIQAQASICSMTRLLKEKEDALREFEEVLKLNDAANANIIGVMTQQHNHHISSLNEEIQKRTSNVRELESKLEIMERNWFKIKDMCKVKNRQLEGAVEMHAALERDRKSVV